MWRWPNEREMAVRQGTQGARCSEEAKGKGKSKGKGKGKGNSRRVQCGCPCFDAGRAHASSIELNGGSHRQCVGAASLELDRQCFDA